MVGERMKDFSKGFMVGFLFSFIASVIIFYISVSSLEDSLVKHGCIKYSVEENRILWVDEFNIVEASDDKQQ